MHARAEQNQSVEYRNSKTSAGSSSSNRALIFAAADQTDQRIDDHGCACPLSAPYAPPADRRCCLPVPTTPTVVVFDAGRRNAERKAVPEEIQQGRADRIADESGSDAGDRTNNSVVTDTPAITGTPYISLDVRPHE